jgi:RNA polymerase-interacting CarD/CdnL/TRCF family regulator
MDLEDVLIGLSAHEIRHRAQENRLLELVSPEIAPKVKDTYVKRLIDFTKMLFKEQPTSGVYEKEFDAKAIEYMAQEIWHLKGKDPAEIASLIKSGARELQFPE